MNLKNATASAGMMYTAMFQMLMQSDSFEEKSEVNKGAIIQSKLFEKIKGNLSAYWIARYGKMKSFQSRQSLLENMYTYNKMDMEKIAEEVLVEIQEEA